MAAGEIIYCNAGLQLGPTGAETDADPEKAASLIDAVKDSTDQPEVTLGESFAIRENFGGGDVLGELLYQV